MSPTPYRIVVSVLFYLALVGGGFLIAVQWASVDCKDPLVVGLLGIGVGWFTLCGWAVQRAIRFGVWMGWDLDEDEKLSKKQEGNDG